MRNGETEQRDLRDKAANALEWPLILEKLKSECATSAGRERAAAIRPIPKERLVLQLEKISSLRALAEEGFAPDFGGITDISSLAERSLKGSILSLEELLAVKSFLAGIHRLSGFLRAHAEKRPLLEEELKELFPCTGLAKELAASFTEEGALSDARYPILKKLRSSISNTKNEIEKKLNAFIFSPQSEKMLQDKIFTTVNRRYCVMVKSAMKGKINGAVLDVSDSGSTFYMEPAAVKGLNDSLLLSERRLEAETEKISAALSALTGDFAEELLQNVRAAAYIDFLNGAAKFSAKIKGAAPAISDTPVIKLKAARHPLLQVMQPDATVANDIELPEGCRCLIVSGANTGGKTVLLKTIGCAALMAKLGLHIAASPDSEIGIFKTILADIGDDQSMEQALSTYSGQIAAINEMLAAADGSALILMDEIITGTNPRHGAALAQAVLEELAKKESITVVTTHYSELKELASGDKRFVNASVAFDLNTLKPSYRLMTGLPGVSRTLETAKSCGLPETVVNRAEELIDGRELSVEALIEEAQRFRQETEEEKLSLYLQNQELIREAERLRQKEEKLRVREAALKEEKGAALLNELEEWRRQAVERIRLLQGADMKGAEEIRQEIASIKEKAAAALHKGRSELLAESKAPIDTGSAKAGDRVYASAFAAEGTLESISRDGTFATVLFGSGIRAKLPANTLYGVPLPKASEIKKKTKKTEAAPAEPSEIKAEIPETMQTSFNTIDLRGKRVSEAMAAMEAGLDNMFRKNADTVIVIHGHGTGALKQAVREKLRASPYTAGFRQGGYGEGGDGVTVVRIKP